MTTTMQLIAKQTVGAGGATSVTFSNIPQTYTDLKVVCSTRESTDSYLGVYFNGDTNSANYTSIILRGNGSGAASGGAAGAAKPSWQANFIYCKYI